MIVATSSNVLSSIYIVVFDLLLNAILAQLITGIPGKINAHQLSKPAGLFPYRSRLDKIVKYGLTKKSFSRVSSVVGTITLLLTIAGSFSIEGRSRPNYTPISAPVMTFLANSSSSYIDYTKHISPNGSLFSATYLLASHSTSCMNRGKTQVEYFSAMNSFADLETPLFSQYANNNSTCIMEEEGYEKSILYTEREISCIEELRLRTFWFPVATQVLRYNVQPIPLSVTGCPIEGVSAVGAVYKTYHVVLQLKCSKGFVLVTREYEALSELAPVGQFNTIGPVRDTPYDEKVMRSVVRFFTVPLSIYAEDLLLIAQITLKKNGIVMRRDDDLKESVVNMKWLIGTAGVAVIIVAMTGLVRIIIGFKYAKEKRNGLNSALDCIKEAQNVAGEDRLGIVWIGFRREDWSVGPIGEMDLSEGMKGEWERVDEQTLRRRLRVGR